MRFWRDNNCIYRDSRILAGDYNTRPRSVLSRSYAKHPKLCSRDSYLETNSCIPIFIAPQSSTQTQNKPGSPQQATPPSPWASSKHQPQPIADCSAQQRRRQTQQPQHPGAASFLHPVVFSRASSAPAAGLVAPVSPRRQHHRRHSCCHSSRPRSDARQRSPPLPAPLAGRLGRFRRDLWNRCA